MFHSVSAVSASTKVSRDSQNSSGNDSSGNPSDHRFAQIFATAVDEQKKAPEHCHTITYGSDRKLHTFLYQAREYQY